VVTPWDVQGQVSADGKQLAINYDKLIEQFGTRRIDTELLERFEKLTGKKAHPLLKRGMFFSHRYVLVLATMACKLQLNST
jgi:tryptophanyl-tRNA synthetase